MTSIMLLRPPISSKIVGDKWGFVGYADYATVARMGQKPPSLLLNPLRSDALRFNDGEYYRRPK